MFAWLSDQMTTRNEEWCERSISTNEIKLQRKSIDLNVFLIFFVCLFLSLFVVSWEWFGRCDSILWFYQWYNKTNIWISDYHLIISFHSSTSRFEWDGLMLWHISNFLLLFNNTFQIEIKSLIYEIENENHKRKKWWRW